MSSRLHQPPRMADVTADNVAQPAVADVTADNVAQTAVANVTAGNVAQPAVADVPADNVAQDSCQGYEHTCKHTGDNKICVELLDSEGQPLNWGDKGNFWDITDQATPTNLKTWHWDSENL